MISGQKALQMMDDWSVDFNAESERLANKILTLWVAPRCQASAEDGLSESEVPAFDG